MHDKDLISEKCRAVKELRKAKQKYTINLLNKAQNSFAFHPWTEVTLSQHKYLANSPFMQLRNNYSDDKKN